MSGWLEEFMGKRETFFFYARARGGFKSLFLEKVGFLFY